MEKRQKAEGRSTSPICNLNEPQLIDFKNEFQFDVQGKLIGLMIIAGKDSGYIKLESLGEEEDYLA